MSNLINIKWKENGILRKHAKICTTGHFDHMAAALFRDVPLYLVISQKWMPPSSWMAQSIAHCTGKSYEGSKIIFFYSIFKQQPLWNQIQQRLAIELRCHCVKRQQQTRWAASIFLRRACSCLENTAKNPQRNGWLQIHEAGCRTHCQQCYIIRGSKGQWH